MAAEPVITPEYDYVAKLQPDDRIWVTVAGLSLRLALRGGRVVAELYELGHEDCPAIAATSAPAKPGA